MSENLSRTENETNPSNEYLLEEIAKIKTELNQLKNLKDQTFQKTKSLLKRKAVPKRKQVKKTVKRKTVPKRKQVKKTVKRKTSRRK